jgi:hypothetical protein
MGASFAIATGGVLTLFIDAGLAVALGKEGLQPRHLRVRQPEKVADRSVSLRSLKHAASG